MASATSSPAASTASASITSTCVPHLPFSLGASRSPGTPLSKVLLGCQLLLLHWPGPKDDSPPATNEGLAHKKRAGMWRALEAIYEAGQARAIGVSNFTAAHLEPLLAGCSVVPHVSWPAKTPPLPEAPAPARARGPCFPCIL